MTWPGREDLEAAQLADTRPCCGGMARLAGSVALALATAGSGVAAARRGRRRLRPAAARPAQADGARCGHRRGAGRDTAARAVRAPAGCRTPPAAAAGLVAATRPGVTAGCVRREPGLGAGPSRPAPQATIARVRPAPAAAGPGPTRSCAEAVPRPAISPRQPRQGPRPCRRPGHAGVIRRRRASSTSVARPPGHGPARHPAIGGQQRHAAGDCDLRCCARLRLSLPRDADRHDLRPGAGHAHPRRRGHLRARPRRGRPAAASPDSRADRLRGRKTAPLARPGCRPSDRPGRMPSKAAICKRPRMTELALRRSTCSARRRPPLNAGQACPPERHLLGRRHVHLPRPSAASAPPGAAPRHCRAGRHDPADPRSADRANAAHHRTMPGQHPDPAATQRYADPPSPARTRPRTATSEICDSLDSNRNCPRSWSRLGGAGSMLRSRVSAETRARG